MIGLPFFAVMALFEQYPLHLYLRAFIQFGDLFEDVLFDWFLGLLFGVHVWHWLLIHMAGILHKLHGLHLTPTFPHDILLELVKSTNDDGQYLHQSNKNDQPYQCNLNLWRNHNQFLCWYPCLHMSKQQIPIKHDLGNEVTPIQSKCPSTPEYISSLPYHTRSNNLNADQHHNCISIIINQVGVGKSTKHILHPQCNRLHNTGLYWYGLPLECIP